MQKLVLSTILFLSGIAAFCQKNSASIYGTRSIGVDTAMKITEVSIEEWICFIINNNFDLALFPDSNIINNKTKQLFNDLRQGKNFRFIEVTDNPITRNLGSKGVKASGNMRKLANQDSNYFSILIPVTGISYAQALQFCSWKEDIVNKRQSAKIKISLPTTELYQRVIQNFDTINQKNCYLQNSLNCRCRNVGKTKDYRSQGNCLLRVDSYWPDRSGLYCLQGNASEMTATQGVAMGGSFRHFARESFNDKKQTYLHPEEWLGFRYIVTLR